MTEIEYKAVIDIFAPNGLDPTMSKNKDNNEKHFSWCNNELYFSKDCAAIKGKIPLRIIADLLKNQGGFVTSYDDKDHYRTISKIETTSDEFEELKKHVSSISRENPNLAPRLEDFLTSGKELLFEKEPESFYVPLCFLETKEAFLSLLTQMQDHYVAKIENVTKSNRYSLKQHALLSEINKRLIEQSSLDLSSEEWIKNTGLSILEEIEPSSDKLDRKIRKLLVAYNNTINPFTNNKVEMLDPSFYLDKLLLEFGISETGGTIFTITDNKTKNKALYSRDNNSLEYNFISTTGPYIRHSYFGESLDSDAKEEVTITYPYSRDKNGSLYGLTYNITNGEVLIISNDGKPTKTKTATTEQKRYIIDRLSLAINMVKEITIDNMTVPKEKGVSKRKIPKTYPVSDSKKDD